MSEQLLEIHPQEIKFIFEVKKQSLCPVRLVNKSNNHVAFKVKTTSPKKYCVRPKTGLVKPKSTYDFVVRMQAQRLAPPDMICTDKFLLQSTVVPAATTDVDVTPSMFANDDSGCVEEIKLRVILIRPPDAEIQSLINNTLEEVIVYEDSKLKDQVLRKVENPIYHFTFKVPEDVEEYKMENNKVRPAKDVDYRRVKDVENPAKDVEHNTIKDIDEPAKTLDYKTVKEVEEPAKDVEYNTTKDIEEPAKDVDYKTVMDVEEPAKEADYKTVKDVEDPAKVVENEKMKDMEGPPNDVEHEITKDVEEHANNVEHKTKKDIEELKFVEDIADLKSRLYEIESKINEASITISKLRGERRLTSQERESRQLELALLRSKRAVRKVQVGFPFSFVCMVALTGVMLGYCLHC